MKRCVADTSYSVGCAIADHSVLVVCVWHATVAVISFVGAVVFVCTLSVCILTGALLLVARRLASSATVCPLLGGVLNLIDAL